MPSYGSACVREVRADGVRLPLKISKTNYARLNLNAAWLSFVRSVGERASPRVTVRLGSLGFFLRRKTLPNIVLDHKSLAALQAGTLGRTNRLAQRVVDQFGVAMR